MPNIKNIDEFSQKLRKDLGDHFDMMMAGNRILNRREIEDIAQ